jgi:hypothetical protein
MTPSWFLELSPGVFLTSDPKGQVALSSPDLGRLTLRGIRPATLAAFERLSPPGECTNRLAHLIQNADGPEALARWHYSVQRLARCGMLHFSVRLPEERLGTLVPIAPGFTFCPAVPLPNKSYVL